MTAGRKYLKDVLPRLYAETVAFLEELERPDLLEQLPHLYISDRCDCGGCSDFNVDSDIVELSRELGSVLRLRPLYWKMPNGFSIGISGKEGLTEGQHDKSYVAGFDLRCGDYLDGYINKQLIAHGFP